jgi:hypothetical protein
MSVRTVTSTEAGTRTAYQPSLRTTSGKIHTTDDAQRSKSIETSELAELIAKAESALQSAEDLLEQNGALISANAAQSAEIRKRIETQVEGQPGLSKKIQTVEKSTAEAHDSVLAAKKATLNALFSLGALGLTASLKTMDCVERRGEVNDPQASSTQISRTQKIISPQHRSGHVTLRQESTGIRSGTHPLAPRSRIQPFCANQNHEQGNASWIDVAEHTLDGDYGQAIRDFAESQQIRDNIRDVATAIRDYVTGDRD